MSNYHIEANTTIFNSLSESIFIKRVTPKYIIFDSYDDCGELFGSNLKRYVYQDTDNQELYIVMLKKQKGYSFTIRYHN